MDRHTQNLGRMVNNSTGAFRNGDWSQKMEVNWTHPQKAKGRLRDTWRRIRDRDVEQIGREWREVKVLARDRWEWRVFVGGLYPGAG